MKKPGQLNGMQVGSYELVWSEGRFNDFNKENCIRTVREQKKVPRDQTLEKRMTVETGSYSVTQVNQQSVLYSTKAISIW